MFTIVSLFDGMSCGQIAINRLGLKYGNYYASEVDKYAISVTQHNYPNTIQVGDVSKLDVKKYRTGVRLITEHGERYFIKGKIILIGGSPCQGFSFAGKMNGSSTKCKIDVTSLEQYLKLKEEGFEFDGQSYLFWEYIRIKNEINPAVFLLENVMMTKKWKDMFNAAVGVNPIMINSSLVSAQNRKRLYWTNIKGIEQPEDKGIVIADILEDEVDEKYYMKQDFTLKYIGDIKVDQCNHIANVNGHDILKRVYGIEGKSPTITTNKGEGSKVLIIPEATKQGYTIINDGECFDYTQPKSKTRRGRNMSKKSNCLTTSPQYYKYEHPRVRKLTPLECERLQTAPDDYTLNGVNDNNISNSQRYKMLGNGWTIDTICHILRGLGN